MSNMLQTSKLRPKKDPNTKTLYSLKLASGVVTDTKEHTGNPRDVGQSVVMTVVATEKQPEAKLDSASTEDSSFSSSGDDDLPNLSPEMVEKVFNLINRKQSMPLPDKKISETPKESEPEGVKEADKAAPASVDEDVSMDDEAIALAPESYDLFSDDDMMDESLKSDKSQSPKQARQAQFIPPVRYTEEQSIPHLPVHNQRIPQKPIQEDRALVKPYCVTSGSAQIRSDQNIGTASSIRETQQTFAQNTPSRQSNLSNTDVGKGTSGYPPQSLDASSDRMSEMSDREEMNSTPPDRNLNQSTMSMGAFFTNHLKTITVPSFTVFLLKTNT